VWVPVVEQTTRTGVLAVTVPHAGPQMLAQAESLGVFTGLVVAAAGWVSDVPHLQRRGRAMSLPAGMQWDLLPPLSGRKIVAELSCDPVLPFGLGDSPPKPGRCRTRTG